MARIRTIKPEFWTDEKVVALSPLARLLFIGMWNFVDDEGRAEWSPMRLKMQVLPGDDADVSMLLDEIRRVSLIQVYVIDGKEYFYVCGFVKHQKVDKRRASKIPEPPSSFVEARRIAPNCADGSRNGRKEKEPPNGGSKKRGTRLPPDFEPDVQTGIDAGLSRSDVLGEIPQFRDHFTAAPGQKGVRVDWPATWRMWCRNAAKWKAERNARGSHGPRQQPRSGHATAFEFLGDFAADEAGEVGWQVDDSCFVGDDGTPTARTAHSGPVLAVIAGGEADAQGSVRRIGAPRGSVSDGERDTGGVDEASDGWLPDGGGGHARLGLASRRG